MKPTIHLCLTHDWELRGNGSGSIEEIQFAPLRRLLEIYSRHAVRTTLFAEAMQQLAFRRFEEKWPELKTLADEWDALVRESYERGHDVQLHTHPQWQGARYEQGHWLLDADWSMLNYEPEAAYAMLFECKEYLENLLRTIDPSYRCLVFRAGSLSIAPSPHALNLLVELGITCDTSISGGLHHDTWHVQLDYRNCEEDFLPFYPVMTDARRVSEKPERIICVPIHHFYASRRATFKRHFALARKKITRRLSTSSETGKTGDNYGGQEWKEKRHSRLPALLYEQVAAPYLRGKHFVSDVARLSYPLLSEMLESIRRRASETGLGDVPIVLTNHPKEIRDFAPIERFIAELSQADDIKFLTLAELARKLHAGEFKVRSGRPF
ncbi:MAG TPA: hypothetical protein VK619_11940 [Pyrinomonadaceae bacterium]|nr:hypothetical protein [Pyrinomonadaceae bacterium]